MIVLFRRTFIAWCFALCACQIAPGRWFTFLQSTGAGQIAPLADGGLLVTGDVSTAISQHDGLAPLTAYTGG